MERKRMTEKYKGRVMRMEALLLLNDEQVNVQELKSCCSYGIPDSLRPLCWRILLGYLPLERSQWANNLRKQRETYNGLVEDIIVHPGESDVSDSHIAQDHPLNLNPDSEWNSYFKDNEVLAQIDKDVRRLCPEIDFFQRTTAYPHRSAAKINLSRRIRQECLQTETAPKSHFSSGNFIAVPSKKAEKEYTNDVDENVEYHWQVVERILFIYSKLNPGIKYVQGMNEIAGPLYYAFASDSDSEWAEAAEADVYYCFQLLMSEIKDNFIKTLDKSFCGIEHTMTQFHERLRQYDPELHDHLTELSIKPQFYAFRWLSLLLSQEFSLPDVMTLWDSLFSSSNRVQFLYCICLAMMQRIRTNLLAADFSMCLKMLQNYQDNDVGQLLRLAHELHEGNFQNPNTCNGRVASIGKSAYYSTTRFAHAFSNALKSFSKK